MSGLMAAKGGGGGGFENVGLLTVKFTPKYTQKLQGR